MVKRGEKGDASVLKPSIMFCVPLILDRIYKVADLTHVAYDVPDVAYDVADEDGDADHHVLRPAQ